MSLSLLWTKYSNTDEPCDGETPGVYTLLWASITLTNIGEHALCVEMEWLRALVHSVRSN